MLALLLATFVANVSDGNALTLPAQRHLVQINGTSLLALQQGGADGHGLGFFRSDDGGQSWAWYAPIQDDASHTDRADLLAVGSDIALVYSYEGPTIYGSSQHDVWFQWWRNSGSDWGPGSAVRVFQSPGDSGGYYRAEIAIDSNGFIWVQAFRIEGGGATAVVAVSTDGGNSFSEQPPLGYVGDRGGGRILSLGSSLVFLYGSHGCCDPGRMMMRNDGDPLSNWSGPVDAIPDGLYHGAALSAVADGGGGMHLVYKNLSERMFYRYFDGASFSGPQVIEDVSDWATQASTTLSGGALVVCYNHPVSTNADYRFYRRVISGGAVGDPVPLDDSSGFKGYPTAPANGAAMCMYGRTPDANSAGNVELVNGGY